MEIKNLLKQARMIWGENNKMNNSQIIIALGKIFGDLCRWERNSPKDRTTHTDKELKKELGERYFFHDSLV